MSLLRTPERVRAWLAHREAREAAGAIAVVVAVSLATLLATRSGARATHERCEALLDRYVELRARTVDEHVSDERLDEKRARARAKLDATCRERLSEATARCASEAPSLDVFERCFP